MLEERAPYGNEEYDVIEDASQIAEERMVYGELTPEEVEVLKPYFDTKDNKNSRMFIMETARIFGLEESIFLQQLRGILLKSDKRRVITDKRGNWRAIYNSYEKWVEILPIFSKRSFRRMINKLEKLDIILTKQTPHSKYYGINWKAVVYYVQHPEELEKDRNKLI